MRLAVEEVDKLEGPAGEGVEETALDATEAAQVVASWVEGASLEVAEELEMVVGGETVVVVRDLEVVDMPAAVD